MRRLYKRPLNPPSPQREKGRKQRDEVILKQERDAGPASEFISRKTFLIWLTALRIRRVKCDEERPSCRRCRKYGIECNGYTTLVKFNPQLVQHSQLRPLVTKQHSKGRLEPKQCFRTRLEPLSGLHSGPRLTDQLEGRYFKYYCNERGARVPANCRSPTIWEKIIPQAGESEEFIGHAVAALGALSVSEDLRRDALHPIQSVARSSSGSKPDSHYQYALTQYCKSLKMMQEGLQGRLWGRSRTTLVGSPHFSLSSRFRGVVWIILYLRASEFYSRK